MTEDFDITSIPMEFNPLATLDNTDRSTQGDDRLFVQFRTDAVLNPAKSTKEGRPIYDDVDMIIIRTPGSQLTSIVAPVKHYMDRFGDKYNKWKVTREQAVSGTPLEAFPLLLNKPSLIAELKAINVFTVEQLATLSDVSKQHIMGAHELSRRAADWIVLSKNQADVAEKAELQSQVAAMQAQIAELLAAQNKPAKRGFRHAVEEGTE